MAETRPGPDIENQKGPIDWTAQKDISGPAGGLGRLGARAALFELIDYHEGRARRLRQLLGALPMELPLGADEALWDLVLQARR